MTASEELFHLIKSLSKSEKAYFKKYASIHGKKNSTYMKLFDAVAVQKEYDEQRIKKKFAHEKFSKQLGVTKNYLFHFILKSMEAYSSSHSVDTTLNSLLTRAHFLFRKGRYKEYEKHLDRVFSIAIKYELHHYGVLALSRKRILAWKEQDLKKVSIIKFQEKRQLRLLNNTQQFQDLADKMIIYYFSDGINNKNKKWPDKFITNPLLQNEKKADTFLSKKNLIECYSYYFASKHNAIQLHSFTKKKSEALF